MNTPHWMMTDAQRMIDAHEWLPEREPGDALTERELKYRLLLMRERIEAQRFERIERAYRRALQAAQ